MCWLGVDSADAYESASSATEVHSLQSGQDGPARPTLELLLAPNTLGGSSALLIPAQDCAHVSTHIGPKI